MKKLMNLFKAAGAGTTIAFLAACSAPATQVAPQPTQEVRIIEVPAEQTAVVAITQVSVTQNVTIVGATAQVVTATFAPTGTEAPNGVTVSEWWNGEKVGEFQVMYQHPWTTSATLAQIPVGATVYELAKADHTLFPSGDWRCVRYGTTLFGWMDKDQLVSEPDPADLPIFTADPADPSTDVCALKNPPTPTPTATTQP